MYSLYAGYWVSMNTFKRNPTEQRVPFLEF
jgi:hypothetical protein